MRWTKTTRPAGLSARDCFPAKRASRAAGKPQLSSVRRRRRSTPIGGCLTSRPAGTGLSAVPRTCGSDPSSARAPASSTGREDSLSQRRSQRQAQASWAAGSAATNGRKAERWQGSMGGGRDRERQLRRPEGHGSPTHALDRRYEGMLAYRPVLSSFLTAFPQRIERKLQRMWREHPGPQWAKASNLVV
jgi:hypothetical protein